MNVPFGQLGYFDDNYYYVGSAFKYENLSLDQYEEWKSLFIAESDNVLNPLIVQQLISLKLIYEPKWDTRVDEKLFFVRSIVDFDQIEDKDLSQFIAVAYGMEIDSLFKLLQKEAVVNEEQQKILYVEMWKRLLIAVEQHYIVIDYISDLAERILDPETIDSTYKANAITEINDNESSRYFTIGSIDMERRQIVVGNHDLFALDQEDASTYAEFWYVLRQQLCSYNDLIEIIEDKQIIRTILQEFAVSRLLFTWDKSILETSRLPVALVPQGYLEKHDEDQMWVLNHGGEKIRVNSIQHLYWAYAHPLLMVHQVYERILRDTGYDAVELATHMLESIPALINEGDRLLYIDEAIRHSRSYAELLKENKQLKVEIEKLQNEDILNQSNISPDHSNGSNEQKPGES